MLGAGGGDVAHGGGWRPGAAEGAVGRRRRAHVRRHRNLERGERGQRVDRRRRREQRTPAGGGVVVIAEGGFAGGRQRGGAQEGGSGGAGQHRPAAGHARRGGRLRPHGVGGVPERVVVRVGRVAGGGGGRLQQTGGERRVGVHGVRPREGHPLALVLHATVLEPNLQHNKKHQI